MALLLLNGIAVGASISETTDLLGVSTHPSHVVRKGESCEQQFSGLKNLIDHRGQSRMVRRQQ